MNSIKQKLMLALSAAKVTIIVAIVVLAMSQVKTLCQTVDSTVTAKLSAQMKTIDSYVQKNYGEVSLNSDGQMVGATGKIIGADHKMVDSILKDLGLVSTIFVRKGDDFVRATTSIIKPDGSRAVGTKLDNTGKAYSEVMKGLTYSGTADIMGTTYVTIYQPIKDKHSNVIGILFAGQPIANPEKAK